MIGPTHVRRGVDLAWIAAAIVAVALFAWQSAWVWPYVADDTFISLRYAERFAAGHGLTWNDGERVEGYSNLSWVLATAALIAAGVEPVAAARGLGILCAVAAIVALAFVVRPRCVRSLPGAFAAPALLAVSPPMMVWGQAGLESPMEVLWLVLGFGGLLASLERECARSRRFLVLVSVPFALECVTRPDGALWIATAGIAAALVWARRDGARRAMTDIVTIAALPATFFLGQLAFRLAYYGDFVPNTAHAKIAPTPLSTASALAYITGAAAVMRGLFLLAGLGAARGSFDRDGRARLLVLGAPLVAFAAYLVAVGGDHFLGHRRMLPALVPLALFVPRGLLVPARRPVLGQALAWATALAAVLLVVKASREDPSTAPARYERFTLESGALGRVLAGAFGEREPLLAVNGAGALPFHSKLPAIDMLGLNDRTIARTPVGTGIPEELLERHHAHGHLRGNGDYVLSREPDIIVLGPPPGWQQPLFAGDYHMERDRRFLDGYRAVRLEIPGVDVPSPEEAPVRARERATVRSILWVRLEGRVGVERGPEHVTIPAYLFGSFRQREPLQVFGGGMLSEDDPRYVPWITLLYWSNFEAIASVPQDDGMLALELREPLALPLEDLALPPGRWSAQCDPPDAPVVVRIEAADGTPLPVTDGAFDWRGGDVRVVVEPAPDPALPARLDRVVLRR